LPAKVAGEGCLGRLPAKVDTESKYVEIRRNTSKLSMSKLFTSKVFASQCIITNKAAIIWDD
jgi:hypothetical protein